MIQYPHILSVKIVTGASQDADGNWIPGETVMRTQSCRAEPNQRQSYQITGVDGNKIQFDWTVYMPVRVMSMPVGSEVTITWNSEIVAMGRILRFSNGQLNTRLWL